jgi:hypothetical protein
VINNDMNTFSYQRNAKAAPLNKAMMAWFFKHYTAKQEAANNPCAAPIEATLLENLPLVTVISAEIDPLPLEDEAYADLLPLEDEAYADLLKRWRQSYLQRIYGCNVSILWHGKRCAESKGSRKMASNVLKSVFSNRIEIFGTYGVGNAIRRFMMSRAVKAIGYQDHTGSFLNTNRRKINRNRFYHD